MKTTTPKRLGGKVLRLPRLGGFYRVDRPKGDANALSFCTGHRRRSDAIAGRGSVGPLL